MAFPIKLFIGSMTLMFILTNADPNTFSIETYGATGDGKTDDTLAFVKAWNDTCTTESENPTMVIPRSKTFLVGPTIFGGPCISNNINIMMQGTIIAPKDSNAWQGHDLGKWLVFQDITGLVINGVGVLNGNGQGWWDISCRYHPGKGCGKLAPTALTFIDCHQVTINKMIVKNSPQTHVSVKSSDDVHLNQLIIDSPGASPNTDGIHIQSSSNIIVHGSVIKSGDDCISIGDGNSNINITRMVCGPGHGISIGSLGRDGSEAQVENIFVSHVNFTKTTNGARIKTWEGGKGYVLRIRFQHLNFTDVEYPIIIDQHYCDVRGACEPLSSGVEISDVTYSDLTGTSATEVAINFNCSKAVPCTNITLDSIQFASSVKNQELISECNNVQGQNTGDVQPISCIV